MGLEGNTKKRKRRDGYTKKHKRRDGNTKKRRRSSSADTAGRCSSASKSEQKVKSVCDEGNTSADTAGSSSSTSAPVSGGEYEVFLSFRGPDTRKTFTDHLYHALVRVGICTFRDDEDLRVGEEIRSALPKAIEESTISIPIFSRDYASSQWCLRELAKMMECHKTMGHKILPIFYDVEPSNVRHQTGTYEKAFRQHLKHFDKKTVQGWKEAMREIGEMTGWELKEATKGKEGELVKRVVSKVLLELGKNYMVLPDNLVGIDHHEEEMTKLLHVGFNGVHIVGIHGMGGIGKTTIAKVIYNKFCECFDFCCFLQDVRATSQQRNGLLSLQNQLISKIQNKLATNDDEGINTIKRIFCKKKVFIVLDDVDDKSPFDKIVNRGWFGFGSRIIVTTRDQHVLLLLNADETYEPPFMEPCHSLELFSKHAFQGESPPEDYQIISKSIVSTAAGLPLALEIIGSFLRGKKKAAWDDTLRKLKEIPDNKVQEKLRISYIALDNFQQQIFLDIACFFIGVDKRLPFYFWDGCGFFPNYAVEVLKLRSLVKIEDDNILRMHDQLRDLGRQIACEKNLSNPGEHSRLFSRDKALDVLENRRGTRNVEALELKYTIDWENPYLFTAEEFKELRNLRYLRVDGEDLDGDFTGLFFNLRWLQWRTCRRQFSPSNIDLKNLVILDLSDNEYLKDNWDGWSQIKMAKRLKVLNLSKCSGLTRSPDFSTLTALEILNIGMREKVEIHPSVWKLKNLRVLDISSRPGDYSDIMPITKFPDEIGNLEKLEEINAKNSGDFHGEIPSSIGRLSSLRILGLSYTNISCLPLSIRGLSRLETLDLLGCNQLQSLPDELPSSLTSLQVTCQSMETFPSCLSNLINLKKLVFYSCVNLVEITRDIGKLSQLKALSLRSCGNLRCILALPPSLFEIYVDYCISLERLPDLSNLKNLSSLTFRHLDKLREIPQFKFGELEYLKIAYCKSLIRLPDLSNLGMLKYLELHRCQKLVEIEGLGVLKSLESMDVSCTSLERLDLSSLKNLKKLIVYCKNLTEIQGIEELESLGFLSMAGCNLIEKLPDLSNLKKLKILIVSFCEKLTEIRGLEELKSLKLLDISGCKSIEINLTCQVNLSNTRIDTNSGRIEYSDANEWAGYEGTDEWESEEWESEEWEPGSPSPSPSPSSSSSPSPYSSPSPSSSSNSNSSPYSSPRLITDGVSIRLNRRL